ncbi:MAG: DUF2267 domain-containing protein [Pseudomonadota bacterium]
MEELVSRLVERVGIDEGVASQAISIIMNFLQSAGPEDKVQQLMAALPGAAELLQGDSGGGGGLGGMLGGLGGGIGNMMGAMGAMNELNAAGLDSGQVQSVSKEVIAFAREKAGADVVDEVISAIPGLEQFL